MHGGFLMKKHDCIVKKVQKHCWKRTHKFGVNSPSCAVKEALEIDAQKGTDFWRKSIRKEMKNVRITFDIRDDEVTLVRHKEVKCHLIFWF